MGRRDRHTRPLAWPGVVGGAITLLMVLLAAPPACRRAQDQTPATPAGPKVHVVVSILPQKYFVEQVGGQFVDVDVLVGPGQNHHTYEPTPQQIAALANTQIYFRIGMPFEEPFLRKMRSSFPDLRIVETQEGVPLRTMQPGEVGLGDADSPHDAGEGEPKEGESHGAGHGERPGDKDPHIWLDPKLVKIQAENICLALQEVDPEHKADYERNRDKFQAALDALDAKIAKGLAPLKGREVYVFHPAYGYFTDAYGLKQVAVETEGKEPGPKRLAELIERAKRSGVKLIFVQPQFSKKTAETLAQEIGATVVSMDPLAPDYMANLQEMARKILDGLKR